MKLKKIDTDSKAYNNFNDAVGFVSGVGAGFTLECMSIPWVKTVFKSRAMKLICLSGIVPVATRLALETNSTSHTIVDAFAYLWNDFVDHVNGPEDTMDEIFGDCDECDIPQANRKGTYLGVEIPDANCTVKEEEAFVNELIQTSKVFWFSDNELDTARHMIETMTTSIKSYGYYSLASYFRLLGVINGNVAMFQIPDSIIDTLTVYGWVIGDQDQWGIERDPISGYNLDLNNYHSIIDCYEVLDMRNKADKIADSAVTTTKKED